VILRLLTTAVAAIAMASCATGTAAAAQDVHTPPCAPDTPSALRFDGLPSRAAFGHEQAFALDHDDDDWEVEDAVSLTMRTGNRTFFTDTTADEFADYYLRLDLGDGPATVSARYVQRSEREIYDPAIEDYTTVTTTCEQTVSRNVAGFRRFNLANCDQLRYRPRRLIIACGDGNFQLRSMRWRSWNGARARGSATALLNDCIPYCAEGRFHRIPARIVASRPRICRRGNGAEGYHYTRLRINYRRPLSRTYFPSTSPRNRRGYTYKSTCFSYDY